MKAAAKAELVLRESRCREPEGKWQRKESAEEEKRSVAALCSQCWAPCKAFAQSLPSALRGTRAVGWKAGSRSVLLQPVLNGSQRGQQQARADPFALGLFAGGA